MKLLKIDNQEGQFWDNEKYVRIDEVRKENILNMMRYILKNDDVSFDQISEDEQIVSPAQALVYKHIYAKFMDLMNNKQEIINSVDTLFKDAFVKYTAED